MTSADQDRLTRLELRLTEQDVVIEDLNAAITAQWRTIDALKRALAQLAEQVEMGAPGASGPPERPPPHY